MEKEKLWNRNYIKVMAANFMLFFAFYVLSPLLPLYLSERFGTSKDMIGIVLSGYTIAALVIRPFSGYIVDSFARKKVLMICISVFFVFFFGYIAAGTLLMFAIVRTLHGAPFGAVTVANSTVAIDVLPTSRRNEGIGYYGLSNNLAMAIAPSIGIYVYKFTNDFMLLFWIALIVAGLGVLSVATVHLPAKEIIKNKNKLSIDRFFLTKAWMLAINIAFFGLCWGVLSNFLALYSKEELGITGGTGTYFMILAIGLVASRLQGTKALRTGKLTRNAAEGILISLVGYTLFVGVQNEIGYYLSALLIGLGNGHMYPAFLNMFIGIANHNERGTANSSILTSWDGGLGIGIFMGGIISEYFGFVVTFWTVVGFNAIGVLMFFTMSRQFYLRRKRPEEG
jgi:MFS family permease